MDLGGFGRANCLKTMASFRRISGKMRFLHIFDVKISSESVFHKMFNLWEH